MYNPQPTGHRNEARDCVFEHITYATPSNEGHLFAWFGERRTRMEFSQQDSGCNCICAYCMDEQMLEILQNRG
jgi:hypothetical protein